MDKLMEIQGLLNNLDEEKRRYFWNYFSNMPEKVMRKSQVVKVPKNRCLVHEGEPVDKIYVLVRGKVEGIEYRVWKMEYGYFVFEAVKTFGTMEMSLELDVYQTALKTVEDSVFLVFSKEVFAEWFWKEPTAVAAQLKEMGQYLLEQSRRERLSVLMSATDRVTLFLIQMYEANAKNGKYILNYTGEELSYKIGISERTVGRIRKKLMEEGCIEKSGKKLLITKEGYEKMKDSIKEIMADL